MRQRGFSLIELMVVVAITAILLVIGLPSFQGSMRSNRVATATNELMSSFALARSEAIRSPGGAAICSTEDGSSCDGDWSIGWMVWIDMDGDGLPDGANDRVLRHVETNRNLVLTMDSAVDAVGEGEAVTIRFDRLGRRIGGDRTVTVEPDVCPPGHDLVRDVDLSPTGQVTITRSNCE